MGEFLEAASWFSKVDFGGFRVILQDLREMRDMQPHKYEHYEKIINELELGKDVAADIISGKKMGVRLPERKDTKGGKE